MSGLSSKVENFAFNTRYHRITSAGAMVSDEDLRTGIISVLPLLIYSPSFYSFASGIPGYKPIFQPIVALVGFLIVWANP